MKNIENKTRANRKKSELLSILVLTVVIIALIAISGN